jgi:NTE family protein
MKLAVVFSGGGAQAAYFGAGVARAIEDAGLEPAVLSGVSAGAINVCGLGTGMSADDLAAMWTRIECADLFTIRHDAWHLLDPRRLLRRPATNLAQHLLDAVGWQWLLDTAPARRTFTKYFGAGPLRITDGVTVVISAVDQGTGGVTRFTNTLPPPHRRKESTHQVELGVDHLLASTAAPLLFPPVRVDGNEYVDAGLVANTPLQPALAYEPDAVIVVSASGITRPAPAATSLAESIGLVAENIAYAALHSDFRHAETVNRLAAAGGTAKKQVDLLLVEPTGMPFTASGFLRFDAREARRIMAHGREVAGKALADWPVLSAVGL